MARRNSFKPASAQSCTFARTGPPRLSSARLYLWRICVIAAPSAPEILPYLPVSLLLAGILTLVLAHRLHQARRLRRRRVSEPAMRVHVGLQRLRRQGCESGELPPEDVQALRRQLGWRRRRQWDQSMKAYAEACCHKQESASRQHLEELLSLTTLR